jgi:hypothetical protein
VEQGFLHYPNGTADHKPLLTLTHRLEERHLEYPFAGSRIIAIWPTAGAATKS